MQEFTNEIIPLEKLPKYQEISLNSPHKNYWKVIVINLSIFLLFIAGALTALILLNNKIQPYANYLIGAVLLGAVLLFILFKASFKKRGFALREKDIVYKSGIIAETTTIIPLNRIQHVALNEGIFSRFYGLATLQIYTAGGQSGHLRIAGIPVESAKVIKEALIKKIDLFAN
ncbi:MAG: PH domain-containing protein [Bacteroidota bacterium]